MRILNGRDLIYSSIKLKSGLLFSLTGRYNFVCFIKSFVKALPKTGYLYFSLFNKVIINSAVYIFNQSALKIIM